MAFFLYPPVQTVAAASPLKFVLDSVTVDVNEDTVTPANNKPLPVKLVDLSGNINITAGDLNVQLDHLDPINFDATRIGDGTNLLGINASNEALTHDADVLAELILQKAVLNLGATAAKQDTAQARFDLLATEARQITLQTRADLLATEASLLALSAKLPASLGIKLDAASLSVTQSTEDRVISNAIKTAVESSESGIAPVDFLDVGVLDSSATNIPTTGVSVVASLLSACKEIEVVDDIGEYMSIRDGAGAVLAYLPLGGGRVKVAIPATTNVKLYSEIGSTINVGKVSINFLG